MSIKTIQLQKLVFIAIDGVGKYSDGMNVDNIEKIKFVLLQAKSSNEPTM